MGWCTIKQTQGITKRLVSDETLAAAQSIIEIACGVFADAVEETDTDLPIAQYIAANDLRWLRMAVAWQAVWVGEHPDLLERDYTTSESADGQSATWGPDGQWLAPLAKRALRNLSWRGTRSIEVGAGLDARGDLDYLDDRLAWTPLP